MRPTRDLESAIDQAPPILAAAVVVASVVALGALIAPDSPTTRTVAIGAVVTAGVLGAWLAFSMRQTPLTKDSDGGPDAHLRVLEGLDTVNRAIQGTSDLQGMMIDALDATLAVLGSDRAWLLFPADPDAPAWGVPMERTTPEYPGAFEAAVDIPMQPEAAEVFREALSTDEPLVFDPRTERELPPESSEQFNIRSQMVMSVRPAQGQPWLFGVHQCSHARVWTETDQRLLREIGHRLGDALNSLLFLRDLQEQAERLRLAELALRQHRELLEVKVEERTQQLHEATGDLIRANAAKDAFLAGMSHELRTPLNSIIGFAGVLGQGLAGELEPEQSRQVSMISRSGERLLKLVNDLLDLSRIESGAMRIELGPVDARVIAHEALEAVRPLADEKGLDARLSAPGDLPTVRSDAGRIHEILANLLGNAIAFTEAGQVRLDVHVDGDSVVFQVADTGIGIADDDRERVFDDYYQVIRDATGKPTGTGLGLSLSRRLARLLGGDLDVESVPGTGSTFTLHVPIEGPPASPAAEPGDERSP